MKSVGIITFHASHNYGSMLQAYALQHVIKGLGYRCEIINFRTERQKELYKSFLSQGNGIRKFLKRLIYFPYQSEIDKKYTLFESFLTHYFTLSAVEYNSFEELKQASFVYDYYISGSDQIWNTRCYDFDWVYFLSFVRKGKRIAYAPSMGPKPQIEVNDKFGDCIKNLLLKYDAVSVREAGTAVRIKDFTNQDYIINLDPTLLLSMNEWDAIIDKNPLLNGPYIFLYTPFYNDVTFERAKVLAKRLGLKIVVSQTYGMYDRKWMYDKSFHPYFASGPKEFLNLCKNATCIIGRSFHLAVFAILLKNTFYIIDGMKDSRIASLLKMTGLESQAISKDETFDDKFDEIDFDMAHHCLDSLKKRSLQWIKDSLV